MPGADAAGDRGSRLVAIGGPAGSGKTTLADALARTLGVRHLDFDEVSLEVVNEGRARLPNLSEAQILARLRDERYRSLAHATGALLRQGAPLLVVSAPFTTEAADPRAWNAWLDACGFRVVPMFVWLQLEPTARRARMVARGSSRDTELLASGRVLDMPPVPVIPALLVDASWPLDQQVAAVMVATS